MSKIRSNFIRNLKRLRVERGYTQEEFAELVEISHSGYSQIERGRTWVSDITLNKIAKALNAHPAELFDTKDRLNAESYKSGLIISIIAELPMLESKDLNTVLSLIKAYSGQKFSE